MIEPETLLPETNPAHALDPVFSHFFMGPHHHLFHCITGLHTLISTGYSSSAWRHAQGSHILKNLFLHPEVCLPVATKFVIALTAPFPPTSFLDYLYYLTLQALFSPWDPLYCSQKSAKAVRTESNSSWILSSSWVLSSSITQQLWDCRHHFSLHFSETTVSSSSPSSLVTSSQAAWKALTHLPLNVIIPQP